MSPVARECRRKLFHTSARFPPVWTPPKEKKAGIRSAGVSTEPGTTGGDGDTEVFVDHETTKERFPDDRKRVLSQSSETSRAPAQKRARRESGPAVVAETVGGGGLGGLETDNDVQSGQEAFESLCGICRRPRAPGTVMLQCSECDELLHGHCVGLDETTAAALSDSGYVCDSCDTL
jgi:PHD-finger